MLTVSGGGGGGGGGGTFDGFENIGSVVQCVWNQGHAASAIVNGWPGATFSANGVSFDINLDGAGNVTVTLGVGDTSAAAIVATANAALPGDPFAVGDAGGLIVTATSSIVITNISSDDFTKIGLPNITRNKALTSGTSIQLPVTINGNEIEQVSNAITVPAGANRASLIVKLTSTLVADLEGFIGGSFLIGWGNGVYGDTIANLFDVPYQAVIDGVVTSIGSDFGQGTQLSFPGQILVVGAVPNGSTYHHYEVTVPPGATKLYVVPWVAKSENPATKPPYTPPSFAATVSFGAR